MTGPVSYVVKLMDERQVCRHIDNVIARSSDSSSTEPEVQSFGIQIELQLIIEPFELSGMESQLEVQTKRYHRKHRRRVKELNHLQYSYVNQVET